MYQLILILVCWSWILRGFCVGGWTEIFNSSGLLSGSPIEPSESSFEMNFYEFWWIWMRENFSRITQNGFLLTWCSIYIVLLLSAYGDHWINSNTLLLSYFSQLLEQCLIMVLFISFKIRKKNYSNLVVFTE